tara:strand:+ start:76 stop:456 length:381 start_codon:yes stop_codon:yes gene_type:complete
MGRYYSGDIEGKWWFGVQPSDVPLRFGAVETTIEYCISNDDDFKDTMKEIETELGDKMRMFDDFFEQNNGYNNEMLIKFFKKKYPSYSEKDCEDDIREYADYKFGNQCIEFFKEYDDDYLSIQSEL